MHVAYGLRIVAIATLLVTVSVEPSTVTDFTTLNATFCPAGESVERTARGERDDEVGVLAEAGGVDGACERQRAVVLDLVDLDPVVGPELEQRADELDGIADAHLPLARVDALHLS